MTVLHPFLEKLGKFSGENDFIMDGRGMAIKLTKLLNSKSSFLSIVPVLENIYWDKFTKIFLEFSTLHLHLK